MKGKLIVIEGTDAVGKRTQAQLLAKELKRGKFPNEIINFPTYGSAFGKPIKRYLRGDFGRKDAMPPELIAALYALDRYQYKQELEGKLKNGAYIIANRYSQSNLYQAAKISNERERREFIEWLDSLESRLPQADAVVFLNLPVKVSRGLLRKRGLVADIHERDAEFQEKVRKLYLQQARKKGWIVVDCFGEGKLKGKKAISASILKALSGRKII